MSEPVKYLLRGGPLDGELVDPPPSVLAATVDAIADGFGLVRGRSATFTRRAVVYEFSPDDVGVLVGRPATDEELQVEEAFAEIAAEDAERTRTRELTPVVLAALRQADRLLEGDRCVAASRDDVVVFVARGATAARWKDALEALGPEHGCIPEEVPDDVWDAL